MSLLMNPDFETGQEPWDRQNMPGAVDLEVITDKNVARTGSKYLQFRTAEANGSIAQTTPPVTAPRSVTAIAYVRAKDANVSGSLAIWDLDASISTSAPFTAVGQTWTQVVVMLGMKSRGANHKIRIELYQDKPNLYLYVDSVNAF
jgi:hypothetical protein